jgi:membrane-bound metal-dependent hydrolase YbcI (DUF457 family)
MLIRTHLSIVVAAIILILPNIDKLSNIIIFSIVALFATLIPDIDNSYSFLGKYKVFRPLQFFVQHRGPLHSFSFMLVVFILLYFFHQISAFAFLLGFGLHLFLDGFTKKGIYPLWPYTKRLGWRMKTGGLFETVFFVAFVVTDVFLFYFFIQNIG